MKGRVGMVPLYKERRARTVIEQSLPRWGEPGWFMKRWPDSIDTLFGPHFTLWRLS